MKTISFLKKKVIFMYISIQQTIKHLLRIRYMPRNWVDCFIKHASGIVIFYWGRGGGEVYIYFNFQHIFDEWLLCLINYKCQMQRGNFLISTLVFTLPFLSTATIFKKSIYSLSGDSKIGECSYIEQNTEEALRYSHLAMYTHYP